MITPQATARSIRLDQRSVCLRTQRLDPTNPGRCNEQSDQCRLDGVLGERSVTTKQSSGPQQPRRLHDREGRELPSSRLIAWSHARATLSSHTTHNDSPRNLTTDTRRGRGAALREGPPTPWRHPGRRAASGPLTLGSPLTAGDSDGSVTLCLSGQDSLCQGYSWGCPSPWRHLVRRWQLSRRTRPRAPAVALAPRLRAASKRISLRSMLSAPGTRGPSGAHPLGARPLGFCGTGMARSGGEWRCPCRPEGAR